MSYNIHIANPPSQPSDVVDIAAIAKVINDVKPDFVALQEVDRFTDRSGKDLDQAEAIAKLTGMKHAFIKAINRSNGEYGLAILSKYEIQESKTFSLPVNQGTGAELRTLGIIRVELGEGRNLLFGTT
ncbi:MAG: endonuclease, partial [Dehalococcoidales bacterium]|nr:endonuclease [Dehalococcoidales bacterium]